MAAKSHLAPALPAIGKMNSLMIYQEANTSQNSLPCQKRYQRQNHGRNRCHIVFFHKIKLSEVPLQGRIHLKKEPLMVEWSLDVRVHRVFTSVIQQSVSR